MMASRIFFHKMTAVVILSCLVFYGHGIDAHGQIGIPTLPDFKLTVTKVVDTGADGSVEADPGTLSWTGNTGEDVYHTVVNITITATAAAGSSFESWSGDGGCSGTKSTCTVLMIKNRNVTATFRKNPAPPYASSINGTITPAFEGAVITTDGGGSAKTLRDGSFFMSHPAGSWNLTVTGCTPYTTHVDLAAGQQLNIGNLALVCLCATPYPTFPQFAQFPYADAVTANVAVAPSAEACTWTAATSTHWITVTEGWGGTGTGVVSYELSQNSTGNSRTGAITIGGRDFTVTQGAVLCDRTPDAFSFSEQTEVALNTTVISNAITVDGLACLAPISITGGKYSINGGEYTSAAGEANNGDIIRVQKVSSGSYLTTTNATLTIGGASNIFSVTTAAPLCDYTLSSASTMFGFSSAQDSLSVVPSESSCTWTAVSNDAWITVTDGSPKTGAGIVSFSIEANPVQITRTGTITIAGLTFTVMQSGTCTYTFSHGNDSFPGAGAADSVTVTTSENDCAWTAASNDAWITITDGSAGTGTGTVYYAVDANASEAGRSGSLTIAGQPFNIAQASSCTYALSSDIANFTTPGAAGSVTVTPSSGNCFWSAVSNSSWITVTSGSWGMDVGIVSYSVSPNTTDNIRTGTLTIAGQTFTVVQNGNTTPLDKVQKAYIGYYQRPGDPGGLIWWANALAANGGDLSAIIEAFAHSAESQTLYGTIDSGTIAGVIDAIYLAFFGRSADAAGRDWYVAGFNAGAFTAATIMLNILDGAQNYDLVVLSHKLTAANLFTRTIDPELDGASYQVTYAGDNDANAGRYFLRLVTSASSTIPTQSQIMDYIRAYIADPGDSLYQSR